MLFAASDQPFDVGINVHFNRTGPDALIVLGQTEKLPPGDI